MVNLIVSYISPVAQLVEQVAVTLLVAAFRRKAD